MKPTPTVTSVKFEPLANKGFASAEIINDPCAPYSISPMIARWVAIGTNLNCSATHTMTPAGASERKHKDYYDSRE